jgi:septal ring-binding cell division protein DamX
VTRALLALAVTLCAVTFPAGVVAQAARQTDSLRREALSVAQTRPDSARAMIRRLLASVPASDSLYPGVLLTAGQLAGQLAVDAPVEATYLQRIVVEYGRSVWADSALLLLTQLNFAQGDPAGTVQAAERMRRDYPDSPLKPRADLWGARAYFGMKDDSHGCQLIQEALAGAGDNIEFKNQVAYYAARCASVPAPAATAQPAPPTAPPLPTPTPSYAVQVLAVASASQVDDVLSRLKVMGYDARVVRDTSGLFKVRVGHYATREQAQAAQRQLKARIGGRPFVVQEP